MVQTWIMYLLVQGLKRIPIDLRLPKVTKWSKFGKGYLVLQGLKRIPSDPKLAQGTLIKVCCLDNIKTFILSRSRETLKIINRPGVAGAFLQSPP